MYHLHTQTNTHTHTDRHTHTYTYTHRHTHTHTQMTHTHTDRHTHTLIRHTQYKHSTTCLTSFLPLYFYEPYLHHAVIIILREKERCLHLSFLQYYLFIQCGLWQHIFIHTRCTHANAGRIANKHGPHPPTDRQTFLQLHTYIFFYFFIINSCVRHVLIRILSYTTLIPLPSHRGTTFVF